MAKRAFMPQSGEVASHIHSYQLVPEAQDPDMCEGRMGWNCSRYGVEKPVRIEQVITITSKTHTPNHTTHAHKVMLE